MNYLLAGLQGVCRQMPGTDINFPREEKLLKKKEDWFIAGDPKMRAVVEKHKSTVSWELESCYWRWSGHVKQLSGESCCR